MKLTVEVTQTSFIYEYEIGENRHRSTGPISADLLCSFTDLLKHCANVTHAEYKRKDREITIEAVRREMEAGFPASRKSGDE